MERKNGNLHDQARTKVRSAILAGKLNRKPCQKCGATDVQAHHVDYNKPLDVTWLCLVHHKEADIEQKLIHKVPFDFG